MEAALTTQHADNPAGTGEPGALVTVEHTGGVAILRLDDPKRRNALSPAMSSALAGAVDTALAAGAGAMVLTASPPVFCSGGSLDDLISPVVPLRDSYAGFQRLADAPVPTIAAVAGAAIGAGVNLPLACDVVLATPSASFDPRFLDVGIHPGGGHLWRLAGRVGEQGAAALVLCGDRLTGEEAAAAGLAWRCVDDDDLLETALVLARRAAGRPRDLVIRTKSTLRAGRAVTSPAQAAELELAAQEWSVTRPGYTEHLIELRDRLRSRGRG
ncbi:enoyl-CoA hydratase-related protein [Frankia gtarii]|uniref:enoyl-CoA hydratase-related protein n=1 Tax=Frankia gtarii TaxID=2950102 RepID=UPI0021BEF1D6|nr:enoyl-CoA hydratase-related protein [Frankia gtarii]